MDDVSLTVPRGEFLTLLGPSGSGKTTVLRSLNVLETPDAGRVRIADAAVDFGDDSVDRSRHRRTRWWGGTTSC